jgi:hypothetical protein
MLSLIIRHTACPVPPTVPHAKCNDGARAIGTIRTYTCESGYLQRGKSTIQCQRDFTWTPLSLDFECVCKYTRFYDLLY